MWGGLNPFDKALWLRKSNSGFICTSRLRQKTLIRNVFESKVLSGGIFKGLPSKAYAGVWPEACRTLGRQRERSANRLDTHPNLRTGQMFPHQMRAGAPKFFLSGNQVICPLLQTPLHEYTQRRQRRKACKPCTCDRLAILQIELGQLRQRG